MLILSEKHPHSHTQKNVQPNIWTPCSPIRLTHKIHHQKSKDTCHFESCWQIAHSHQQCCHSLGQVFWFSPIWSSPVHFLKMLSCSTRCCKAQCWTREWAAVEWPGKTAATDCDPIPSPSSNWSGEGWNANAKMTPTSTVLCQGDSRKLYLLCVVKHQHFRQTWVWVLAHSFNSIYTQRIVWAPDVYRALYCTGHCTGPLG